MPDHHLRALQRIPVPPRLPHDPQVVVIMIAFHDPPPVWIGPRALVEPPAGLVAGATVAREEVLVLIGRAEAHVQKRVLVAGADEGVACL